MDRRRPEIRIGKPNRTLLPDRFMFRETQRTWARNPVNTGDRVAVERASAADMARVAAQRRFAADAAYFFAE